ncbi:MAG: hypothetical protein WD423_10845 [Rhodothermales bacterium]
MLATQVGAFALQLQHISRFDAMGNGTISRAVAAGIDVKIGERSRTLADLRKPPHQTPVRTVREQIRQAAA